MVQKTLNPLHFEDMEPHRFEDLVRNLLYDFRDWRTIEATGRGGGDDGFDVRAWEKAAVVTNRDELEVGDAEDGIHPMEGNLWMIQCKREKQVGPKRVPQIVEESLAAQSPPYGFILVAPVSFSKKCYDVFRDTLRAKGVMEFYLWGKSELEDMLFLPKNDRILFAFMGISLVSRRRSVATEVKFGLNNKNKLLRVLNDGVNGQDFDKPVLLRDINDEHYPREQLYEDFDANPRWREYSAWGFSPDGLLIEVSEHFAYVDHEKKEFDFAQGVDLAHRESDDYHNDTDRERRIIRQELHQRIHDYWEHLPRKHKTKYRVDSIVPYREMLVIDDKGDVVHNFLHIFLDCTARGSLLGGFHVIERAMDDTGHHGKWLDEDYKRVKVFPSVFPDIAQGRFHEDMVAVWSEASVRSFKHGWLKVMFDVDSKFRKVKPRDMMRITGDPREKEPLHLRVTYRYQTTVAEYLAVNSSHQVRDIESQVGREVRNSDILDVFEIENYYRYPE